MKRKEKNIKKKLYCPDFFQDKFVLLRKQIQAQICHLSRTNLPLKKSEHRSPIQNIIHYTNFWIISLTSSMTSQALCPPITSAFISPSFHNCGKSNQTIYFILVLLLQTLISSLTILPELIYIYIYIYKFIEIK